MEGLELEGLGEFADGCCYDRVCWLGALWYAAECTACKILLPIVVGVVSAGDENDCALAV